jgi:hypothetical protein
VFSELLSPGLSRDGGQNQNGSLGLGGQNGENAAYLCQLQNATARMLMLERDRP